MNKNILILFTFILFLTGCSENFLDKESLSDLAGGTFWQSEDDAILALDGCYAGLQSNYLFNSDPWSGGAMRLDYISDNGYCQWGWMPWASFERSTFSASSWGNNDFYTACYSTIARCNEVIENVPNIEGLDTETSNEIIAEAKFIRALVYNYLVMTYTDVPLSVQVYASLEEANIPKSSKSEIVEYIINDLKGCYEDLPTTRSDSEWGRATQGAALALLARIYLYNEYYSEAAAAAQQVIDLGVYNLFEDYTTLFYEDNEQNDEIIFSVCFTRGVDEGSSFGAYWGHDAIGYQLVLPNLADEYYCTDGLPIDESSLYNSDTVHLNRDPRMSATIITNFDIWRDGIYESDRITLRKYVEEDNDLDKWDSGQDWYVFRYAHILLIRAEALVMSGDYDETEVRGLINEIRERIDMPLVENVEGTGLSSDELLDIIKHERRCETAFEGLRYFDLKRWGIIGERYEWYNENEAGVYASAGERIWESIYEKWPLPQADIDASDGILVQHDGY